MSLDNIGRQANLINLVTDEFLGVGKLWLLLCHTTISEVSTNTSRSTITLVNVNAPVVAFFSTGGGVKGKKNLYLLTLLFIYKLAFILFVMTPGAQTTGNIAVYGSAKQLVI